MSRPRSKPQCIRCGKNFFYESVKKICNDCMRKFVDKRKADIMRR